MLFLLSAESRAELLVHEPFEYKAGKLAGATGGTGFASPWDGAPGAIAAEPLPPTFGYQIAQTGGYFRSTQPDWKSTRKLSKPAGATPGTIWFSCLLRNDTGTREGLYGTISLDNAEGKGVSIGQNFNGREWSLKGGKPDRTGLSSNDSKPVLLVAKITFGANGGDDAVELYANPDLGRPLPTATARMEKAELGVLETVRLQSKGGFSYDEIRVGETLEDVTPRALGPDGKPLPPRVDWAAALRMPELRSGSSWIVPPGGKDLFSTTVTNTAPEDWQGVYRFELCDAEGKVLRTSQKEASIPAGKRIEISSEFSFDPAWRGEYLVRASLLTGSKPDLRFATGWERSVAVAAPEDAFILFDKEPVERGMTFDRNKVTPLKITTGGLQRWVWQSRQGSAELGWWKTIRMNITDARLKNGSAPVVDVTAAFCQLADASVRLAVDTAAEGGFVKKGWGGRGPAYDRDPPFKLLKAEIDDALFAGTVRAPGEEDDSKLLANGCDLRMNNCNADGRTRAIFIRPIERAKNPDWSRLLRVQSADAGVPRCVWEPGAKVEATLRLVNRATVPYQDAATITLRDMKDQLLWTRSVPVSIEPSAEGTVPVSVDTTGLPYGVYPLRWELGGGLAQELWLTVADTEPLPKAKEGEFIFGNDIRGKKEALYDDRERSLDWADWMGFDLARNCMRANDADLPEAIALLKRRGMRGSLMYEPRWNADPKKFAQNIEDSAAKVGEIAKKYGDFFHYYELGNEPDLPFFFRGTPEEYVRGYVALYDAIKANDPDSVVMNGGLCFHSEIGDKRAREIVALIPPDKIDAWAYHGHGEGAKAERRAWERQLAATKTVGKDNIPFIETESGFPAHDLPTYRIQARTIVQKVVYALSKGMPLFIWFCHSPAWEWGIMQDSDQARPAALAHRVMVKHLRGLTFAGQLDLGGDGEAYWFQSSEGNRVAVLWSNGGEFTRTLSIGEAADIRVSDHYGNTAPPHLPDSGLVQVSYGRDPVWISWKSKEPSLSPTIPPSSLEAPRLLRVVPGRESSVALTVRNPSKRPVEAELESEVAGVTPAEATPSMKMALAADETRTVSLRVPVAEAQASWWPRVWTVFRPLEGDLDPGSFTEVPASLEVLGKTFSPELMVPQGGNIDLAIPGRGNRGFREKEQALCFAEVHLPDAAEVEIGAGADWWMEWWINGKKVFDTVSTGNGGVPALLSHTFPVKLQKGRNLLVVRVLSGSAGFRLVSGGPDEAVAARRSAKEILDGLKLQLKIDGQPVAIETMRVEILHPISIVEGSPDWGNLPPAVTFTNVVNLHDKQPDQKLWYKGASDLSGSLRVIWNGGKLAVCAGIADDVPKPGDQVLIELATGDGWSRRLSLAADRITIARDEMRGLVWYTAKIDPDELNLRPGDKVAIRSIVKDDDWGEPKQSMSTAESDDPETWWQASVPKS